MRDSHFENSRDQDLILPPHSHSVRRCTSVGSAAFIRASQPGGWSQTLAVQDCLVQGWRDPAGAIQLGNRGPYLVFDSVFADPAYPTAPAINLLGDEIGHLAQNRRLTDGQILVTANLKTENAGAAVASRLAANRHAEIPRERPDFLIETRAPARWAHRPLLPVKIFDAKVDFGAVGNGTGDDSAAIQAAIDAAAAWDGVAEAYLPPGTYRLEHTLEIGDGDLILGGSIAWRTQLQWAGAENGVALRAHNTTGAVIRQMSFHAPDEFDCTGIHVTADRPGAIVLDGVFAGGQYKPRFKGTHLDALPAGFTVRSSHLDGEVTLDHCGDADILLDYYFTGYDAPLTVQGPTGDGFLGIHSAASALNDPDLTVRDSASLVIGDFYTEQTKFNLLATGEPGQRPGRLTISHAKLATHEPTLRVDGYVGQVSASRANFIHVPHPGQPEPPVVRVGGSGDTTLLLFANTYRGGVPKLDVDNARVLQFAGNVWGAPEDEAEPTITDQGSWKEIVESVNVALDHFRELSEHAMR